VDTLKGSVTATRADGSQLDLSVGDPVFQGDVLVSAKDSAAAVLFADETVISLGEKSTIVLDEMVYDPGSKQGKMSLSAVEGVFVFVSGAIAKTDPNAMTIDTAVATIGIRGTQAGLKLDSLSKSYEVLLMEEVDGKIGEVVIDPKAEGQPLIVLNVVNHLARLSPTAAPVVVLVPGVDYVVKTFAPAFIIAPPEINTYGVERDAGDHSSTSDPGEFVTAAGDQALAEEVIQVTLAEPDSQIKALNLPKVELVDSELAPGTAKLGLGGHTLELLQPPEEAPPPPPPEIKVLQAGPDRFSTREDTSLDLTVADLTANDTASDDGPLTVTRLNQDDLGTQPFALGNAPGAAPAPATVTNIGSAGDLAGIVNDSITLAGANRVLTFTFLGKNARFVNTVSVTDGVQGASEEAPLALFNNAADKPGSAVVAIQDGTTLGLEFETNITGFKFPSSEVPSLPSIYVWLRVADGSEQVNGISPAPGDLLVGLEDLDASIADFNFTDLVFSVHSDVVLPSSAKLTIRPDGAFTYDPNGAFDGLNEGEIGKDGFLYTVIDSTGASTTGQVEIDIVGVGNGGSPVDDGFQVTVGQPVNPVVAAVEQQVV
jgi:hypothetical protein